MKLWSIPYRHTDGREHTLNLRAESADAARAAIRWAHEHSDPRGIETLDSDPEGARRRIRAAYFQGNPPEEIVLQVQAPKWLGKLIGGQ